MALLSTKCRQKPVGVERTNERTNERTAIIATNRVIVEAYLTRMPYTTTAYIVDIIQYVCAYYVLSKFV